MYRGVMLLYSLRDNLHSVPAVGYNSIQRPVILVSTSIYCFYLTTLVCFPDPPSLPCDNTSSNGKAILSSLSGLRSHWSICQGHLFENSISAIQRLLWMIVEEEGQEAIMPEIIFWS